MLKRYDGFGKELYTLISHRMPDVFTHLKFYSPEETHPCNDSYAVYQKDAVTFVIQLSYYNAICVWNEKRTWEIQDWGQDYYKDTLQFIAGLTGAELQPKQ